MKKINVAILMGGKSPEHEISILSGQQVVNNLNYKKYNVLPVLISKTGSWQLTSKDNITSLNNPIKLMGTQKEIKLTNKKEINKINSMKDNKVNVIFIAMHGPYGEDGTIQEMLELMNIPYTGSGVLASALGMDKIKFRKIMKVEKIPIPNYIVVTKNQKIKTIKSIGDFPYFVKPYNQGSSVGASIAKNQKELKKSLDEAFKYSDKVLIDEYIQGRELTCSVIGNNVPIALPVLEIVPKRGDFFNYKSKYIEGGSEEFIPNNITKYTIDKVKKLSIKVYKAIGCRGFARVDFLLRNDNLYVLEINSIPGLTQMSLFPRSAKAYGLTYSQLLDKIIKLALEK